jgi:hypothetical protein
MENGRSGRAGVMKILGVSVQLSLIVLLMWRFEIVSAALLKLSILALLAFPIHAFLPLRHRLGFFAALSLTGVFLVMGPEGGGWLVGLGLLLIGVCHLPAAFAVRVVLLLAVGTALAVLRYQQTGVPWPSEIWPILGSMFMFRLILYMYDLRHASAPTSLVRSVSYFFMLPNVCFPLFPVVDYKKFCSGHYRGDPHQLYQTGIEWILRGIAHLILYRVVYYYFAIAPQDVHSLADLARLMSSAYLLYLHVSGQFHLIVGMLHLFGFGLPRTNHHYFLASSFTDLWRRINIHWKDFMVKVVFRPAYFRLRRWNATGALVLSTLIVFAVTALLHSYQWFWLRGTVSLRWNDVLFWAVLAGLVAVNTLQESRRGRERTLGHTAWTLRGLLAHSLRVAGTLSLMCILWSLWNSASVSDWLSLWSVVSAPQWLGAVLAVAALSGAAVLLGRPPPRRAGRAAPAPTFWRSAAAAGTGAIALLLIGSPWVHARLASPLDDVVASLRSARLSAADSTLLRASYYENLIVANRVTSPLLAAMERPADWVVIAETAAMRKTGDFLREELVPSTEILFKEAPLRINRWGFRDQDYQKRPPPGTFRTAVLGSSTTMGSGVSDDETFESLVEGRLNETPRGGGTPSYELLNFGVPGRSLLQHVYVLEKQVLSFEPDAILLVAHANEPFFALRHLAKVVENGIEIPYAFLEDLTREAGVDPQGSTLEITRQLTPFIPEIISWGYRSITRLAAEHGITPVWVYLPMVRESWTEQQLAKQIRAAREAGFEIWDLSDAFEGHDPSSLLIAEWDKHPNAMGHRLIADRLLASFREHEWDPSRAARSSR